MRPFNGTCNICKNRRKFGHGIAKKDIPRMRLCGECDLNEPAPKTWIPDKTEPPKQ